MHLIAGTMPLRKSLGFSKSLAFSQVRESICASCTATSKDERSRKGKEDMIKLHDKNTQELIGEINEKQLQFLIDELVEEDSTDQDYYINRDQLDQLEKKGGDETLIQMLREALGTKDDMDIIWSKS